LIWLDHHRGHDQNWTNNARNAIKGSCNIYFSRLADRLDAPVLQYWLFRFGFGHRLPLEANLPWPAGCEPRRFLQVQGIISTRPPGKTVEAIEDLPPISDGEKRYFGMGQGNLRTSPLQVANAFATLARGGQYKPPRLFLKPQGPRTFEQPVDLEISAATLQAVYDGMGAVVNELGGTAYKAFHASGLGAQGVKVYGKTGSTEDPENAWFAGFAEDSDGAKIAVAVVVEGGQHGSSDAAPLARDIIQLCVYKNYVGTPVTDVALP
jgi:penicillin-binding protein 2